MEFNIDQDHWSSIFQIPFSSLRDSTLKYFQFRFLHCILGTNRLLTFFLMKQWRDALCAFCKQHGETLSHLFWNCVSNFILGVEQRVLGQQFSLSKQDLFLVAFFVKSILIISSFLMLSITFIGQDCPKKL